ncbi:MAG: RHS repeat-associated core domain-containing protein [Bacteroidaceae bacterium]|nr:RHS repeat-associated core domain-containing protein [Bacteroidaceae bacterium]
MKALHTYNTSKANFTFCYYDKDHLGNVRQVTELDGSRGGNVIQRNNYYPFGAEFCDNTAKSSVQSRKYNGKEFDRMHGLNTYDYGARQYNPVTARWDRVDPLAHEYYSISPYVYCMNNPVRFVDPDGRRIKGQTRNDAEQVVEDLRAIFSAEEFNNFRNLIVQSGKKQRGKTLAKISDDAFKAAFDNVKLSKDQQVLANMVFNTINSDDVHTIEYAETGGIVSEDAKNAFNPVPALNSTIETYGGLPTFLIENAGGGGLTMKTSNGTHTVVVNSSSLHPVGRAVTTGHELFGHGRSLALGRFNSQHVDAIQTENLIRRVMGITSINDGSNHANREYISNPTSLPEHR